MSLRSVRRALVLLLALAPAGAAETPLVFYYGGREALRLTAAQMRTRPDARVVEEIDPFYGRRKRFRAVPLRGLLTTAYGASWGEDTLGSVFFQSLDGYRAHARTGDLMAAGGWLAFEDADVPGWEEVPGMQARPDPFYLFWTGSAQKPSAGFPWPWQIVSLHMGMVDDEYPKAVPRGAAPGSAPTRGWRLFHGHCISCHAMSGQGGKVGPDLNVPKGVTRYHDKKQLKAYVKKASAFRQTKMPDFDGLSDGDLDDLMAYLDFMSELAGTK